MGVGRFAYTVLLPEMMQTYDFNETTAGTIAAWNYAGYFMGVFAVRGVLPGAKRYLICMFFLLISLITTFGMGLVHTSVLWYAMRFFAGIASGVCFVLCSSIVLDTLTVIKRPILAGLLYSGVGAGIALGAITAIPLALLEKTSFSWFAMALLCLPLAVVATVTLRPKVNFAPTIHTDTIGSNNIKIKQPTKSSTMYKIVLIAYFLEGIGYIIGVTFLVALIQSSTGSAEIARVAWIITGVAAAISAPLWRLAAGRHYLPMLILALVLQSVGMLLPALSTSNVAIFTAGLLLGGTFMGITVLALQYGVMLNKKSSAHVVANMTAIYGVGQIIGPLLVAWLAKENDLSHPFLLSSIILFFASSILFLGYHLHKN